MIWEEDHEATCCGCKDTAGYCPTGCEQCDQPVCDECVVRTDTCKYCPKCYAELLKDRADYRAMNEDFLRR
jgi:hypothetical protein